MKRDRLFTAISDIDDAYISEARAKKKAKKKNKWLRFGITAAVFVLLCTWLFTP